MSSIFESIFLNNLCLPNRFVRSATYEGLATDNGMVTNELLSLYRELAGGQIGLIIAGYAYVQPNGKGGPGMLGIYSDEHMQGLSKLAATVHEEGGRIAAQIVHCGRQVFPELIEGPPVAPSPIATKKFGGSPRELTGEEISDLVNDFGKAAARAKAAGFDAVQIHCAHGYLLNQFLSKASNRRTDKYGGGIQERAEVLFQVYRSIRDAVGFDYPVLIKLNSKDFVEEGLELAESLWVAQQLARMGIDAIEVSGGVWDTTLEEGKTIQKGVPRRRPEGYFLQYAEQFTRSIPVPIIAVGGFRSLEIAEAVISEDRAAMVALSRPLVREPWLIKRWKQGDHTVAECVSCNRCLALTASRGLSCFKKNSPVKAADIA